MALTDLIPGGIQAKLIVYGLLAACLFGAGFYTAHRFDGETIAKMKADVATQDAAALAKAMQDAYGQAQADNSAALAAAQAGEHIRTVYKTVYQEVQGAKNLSDCDLGESFRVLWNRASTAGTDHPAPTSGRKPDSLR